MDRTPVGPGTLLAGRFVLEDLLDETEGARFWRATDKILARSVAVHVIADDDPRVNQWGGAIATGHPLASSGVRLMTQLSRQFAERPDVRYGLTTMCIGIGMGGTVIWENPNWSGDK